MTFVPPTSYERFSEPMESAFLHQWALGFSEVDEEPVDPLWNQDTLEERYGDER